MPSKKKQTSTKEKEAPVAATFSNGATTSSPRKEPIDYAKLNSKTEHFEFLGPPGATLMIIALPLLTWFFAFFCNKDGCPSDSIWSIGTEDVLRWFSLDFLKQNLFDPPAYIAYLSFVFYLAGMYVILPGEDIDGTVLRDGKTLKYKVNGTFSRTTTLR